MRHEQLLPDLIYEYFVMHFHSRFYRHGDMLPTIEQLSQDCFVSLDTVKAVLKRLRNEGYVITKGGKGIKVAFSQSEEERKAYVERFFSQRRSTLPDLNESAELILVSLLTEGLCRINDKDFTYLSSLIDQIKIGNYTQFYSAILRKLNNSLAMNLFWEILLFQGTSMLCQESDFQNPAPDVVRQSLRDILLAGQQRNRKRPPKIMNTSGKEILKTYTNRNKSLELFFSREEPQLPFVWRIYRKRPQLCYDLVPWFLHQILKGKYRDEEFLPSYKKLAESLQVSVMTIRRTIDLLHRLGMVKPINGMGVCILPKGSPDVIAQFEEPDIKRNFVMFFHAFEILAYTCETVTRATFPRFSVEAEKKFITTLKQYLESEDCSCVILCYLLYIMKHCPLMAIREIYGKIYTFFLWGYPLRVSTKDAVKYDKRAYIFTQKILRFLENKDYESFAETTKNFIVNEMEITEQRLYKIGLNPQKLHPKSSIIPIVISKSTQDKNST